MPNNEVSQMILKEDNVAWFEQLTKTTGSRPAVLPFAFTLNGQHSSVWLAGCEFKRSTHQLDKTRNEITLLYSDQLTGLSVRCVVVEYLDFPTVEWTLHFRNDGSADTPIIENIQALDINFSQKADSKTEYLLHHSRGSVSGQRDYEPFQRALAPSTKLQFDALNGKPSWGEWPYYNLEWANGGAIIVIGWPGSWTSHFDRDESQGLHVQAGQQRTHFVLHPQEEVRSPRIVVQRYKGDWLTGQNIWRKWMCAHNMPRPGGKLPQPMTGGFCGYYFPDLAITEKGEKQAIDRYAVERLLPDCWWMDAGWFQMTDDKGVSSFWNSGTWEVEKKRFPNDLRPVFDHARSKGISKSILWFEPERVAPGRWLYEQRPQWLLGREGQYKLLNLGNPEALDWVTNMVDKTLKDAGVTIYREDFNFGPLDSWTLNEPVDRQGINEIKHVTGHLAFWNELLRRDPNRMIDTCASGGHRLDIETLRLSVPLWCSDYSWEPTGMQGITYGLSLWVPYHGTGVTSDDSYVMRSDMAPFFLMSWDMNRKDINFDRLRKLMAEWRKLSEYYQGDFYPLTDYSVANTEWMAWQFNRADIEGGIVQVFRREDSPYFQASFKLRGLEALAEYHVTNADTGKSSVSTGRKLMGEGFTVTMPDKPSAVTYIYRQVSTK